MSTMGFRAPDYRENIKPVNEIQLAKKRVITQKIDNILSIINEKDLEPHVLSRLNLIFAEAETKVFEAIEK